MARVLALLALLATPLLAHATPPHALPPDGDPSLAVNAAAQLLYELYDHGAVVRRHDTRVEIRGPGRAVQTDRRAVTIFDAHGRDYEIGRAHD